MSLCQPAGKMAASGDFCDVCKKAFRGRQKFIRCYGPCASRFHLACLKMNDAEYSFFMSEGESTYKYAACFKELGSVRDENSSLRNLRSSFTTDIPKKVLSP
jgi:hypothetical protein